MLDVFHRFLRLLSRFLCWDTWYHGIFIAGAVGLPRPPGKCRGELYSTVLNSTAYWKCDLIVILLQLFYYSFRYFVLIILLRFEIGIYLEVLAKAFNWVLLARYRAVVHIRSRSIHGGVVRYKHGLQARVVRAMSESVVSLKCWQCLWKQMLNNASQSYLNLIFSAFQNQERLFQVANLSSELLQ